MLRLPQPRLTCPRPGACGRDGKIDSGFYVLDLKCRFMMHGFCSQVAFLRRRDSRPTSQCAMYVPTMRYEKQAACLAVVLTLVIATPTLRPTLVCYLFSQGILLAG